VAAIPFGGGEGDTQDGRIIIVNARAKEILKMDDSSNHIHYIRDLTPWLRDKLGWKKTSMTTDKLQTRVQYRDEANYTYLVTIEPLMRFVLFSLFQLKDGGLSQPAPGSLEIFR
jgi:hypothetical protein